MTDHMKTTDDDATATVVLRGSFWTGDGDIDALAGHIKAAVEDYSFYPDTIVLRVTKDDASVTYDSLDDVCAAREQESETQ